MELIAKKFVSVADILKLGYTIPAGIQLVSKTGYYVGEYLTHVKDEHQDCHTLKNETFKSRPFLTEDLGIMVKVAFDRYVVGMTLNELKYAVS